MCVFLMADLGETTAFLLPSRRHLSQNRPPAHQNELGTSVGDLPCEACRRFPAGNMRTHVQVSPSQTEPLEDAQPRRRRPRMDSPGGAIPLPNQPFRELEEVNQGQPEESVELGQLASQAERRVEQS
jgi:hypothetical protein